MTPEEKEWYEEAINGTQTSIKNKFRFTRHSTRISCCIIISNLKMTCTLCRTHCSKACPNNNNLYALGGISYRHYSSCIIRIGADSRT